MAIMLLISFVVVAAVFFSWKIYVQTAEDSGRVKRWWKKRRGNAKKQWDKRKGRLESLWQRNSSSIRKFILLSVSAVAAYVLLQMFIGYPLWQYYAGTLVSVLVCFLVLNVFLAKSVSWEDSWGRKILWSFNAGVLLFRIFGWAFGFIEPRMTADSYIKEVRAVEMERAVSPIEVRLEELKKRSENVGLTDAEYEELSDLREQERLVRTKYGLRAGLGFKLQGDVLSLEEYRQQVRQMPRRETIHTQFALRPGEEQCIETDTDPQKGFVTFYKCIAGSCKRPGEYHAEYRDPYDSEIIVGGKRQRELCISVFADVDGPRTFLISVTRNM